MHEASIVRSLLTQVEDLLREHDAQMAREIVIRIGPLSGVEAPLMQSAFEDLSPQSSAESATLRIESVALTAKCRDCNSEFTIADFVFRCRVCDSSAVRVTGGDAIELVSVTMDEQIPQTTNEP